MVFHHHQEGVPQIVCSIDIDANGVLSVTAKDNATGKENKIRIEGGSQLSKEDILRERMKQKRIKMIILKEKLLIS
jgi:molecular chaperone DnaK